MKFSGKIAIITGASVGIGRAVAHILAQNGVNVILLDVNYEKLLEVKDELKAYNSAVELYDCDISNEENVNKVILDVINKYGQIDYIINNAGIWRFWDSFVNVSAQDWEKIINVNVLGTVFITKATLPYMQKQKFGRIVNVASVAGVYGNALMSPYSATKGAIISLTKALAKEVATDGILVNSVSPGMVSPSTNPDMNYTKPTDACALLRTGSNIENANLIAFLLSDENGYISGENVIIDGCRRKI